MKIHINIWDDYFEDDYVPEGEIQETYMYVEETDVPLDAQKECLELFLEYMKTIPDLEGVKMELRLHDGKLKYPKLVGTESECYLIVRWELWFQHLTHERREDLVFDLQEARLKLGEHTFHVYSES